jgi:hypothetical protein
VLEQRAQKPDLPAEGGGGRGRREASCAACRVCAQDRERAGSKERGGGERGVAADLPEPGRGWERSGPRGPERVDLRPAEATVRTKNKRAQRKQAHAHAHRISARRRWRVRRLRRYGGRGDLPRGGDGADERRTVGQ